MSSAVRNGFTGAITGGNNRHTSGNVGGTNSDTVVTRKSDFGSFLGDVPSFTGKQRAEEAFSRETWDMPDKVSHGMDARILDTHLLTPTHLHMKKKLKKTSMPMKYNT